MQDIDLPEEKISIKNFNEIKLSKEDMEKQLHELINEKRKIDDSLKNEEEYNRTIEYMLEDEQNRLFSIKKESYSIEEKIKNVNKYQKIIKYNMNINKEEEEKFQELITCKVAPKDVLISLVGTVGKVLVLSDNCKTGIINPRLIKVSLDKRKMLPCFFKYYFESGYLRSQYKEKAHGATMDVLNMGIIKELPFSWCPIDEQRQVVAEIESRMTTCDSIEQTVDTALSQTEALRQSILKEAFEGRL